MGRVSFCDLRVGYGTECPALALTMAVSAALIVPGGEMRVSLTTDPDCEKLEF